MGRSMAGNKGFTLIEVIVIITLGALIAAMMVPFVGTSMIRSSEPVNLITQGFEVNEVIENILADYRYEVSQDDFNLSDFNDNLATKFEQNGVSVTGKFIEFDTTVDDEYIDSNSDQVFDPQDAVYDSQDKNLLLVTAEKNNQTLSILLGD